jgi:hypothetical protein
VLSSTVLFVGVTPPREQLRARGIEAVEAPLDLSAARAAALAPDLVIARPSAEARLERSTSPLALVGCARDSGPLGRFGVVARWTELEPDAFAERIGGLLTHLDEGRETACEDDAGARSAWLSRLGVYRKTGFVVRADGSAATLLFEGKSVPRGAVEGSVLLQLIELPSQRLSMARPGERGGSLRDARVLVVDAGIDRCAKVCEALAASGALVRTLEVPSTSFDHAFALVPTVIVISTLALRAGIPRWLWSSDRWNGAAFVVVEAWDEATVVGAVARAAEEERSAREALSRDGFIASRLEPFGPGRWLKALVALERDLTLRLVCASGAIEVELSGAKVKSSRWVRGDGAVVLGKEALAAFLAARRGRLVAGSRELVDAEGAPSLDVAADSGVRARPTPAQLRSVKDTGPPVAASALPSVIVDADAVLRGDTPATARRSERRRASREAIDPTERTRSPGAGTARSRGRAALGAAMLFGAAALLPFAVARVRDSVRMSRSAAPAALPRVSAATELSSSMPSSIEPRPPVADTPSLPPVDAPVLDTAPEPPDVEDLSWQSQRAWAARDYARSEALVSQAIEHAPEDPELHFRLARALSRQGRDREALAAVERAVELAPTRGAYRLLEGDILARSGRPVLARRAWRGCLRAQPGHRPCRARLAQLRRVSERAREPAPQQPAAPRRTPAWLR